MTIWEPFWSALKIFDDFPKLTWEEGGTTQSIGVANVSIFGFRFHLWKYPLKIQLLRKATWAMFNYFDLICIWLRAGLIVRKVRTHLNSSARGPASALHGFQRRIFTFRFWSLCLCLCLRESCRNISLRHFLSPCAFTIATFCWKWWRVSVKSAQGKLIKSSRWLSLMTSNWEVPSYEV